MLQGQTRQCFEGCVDVIVCNGTQSFQSSFARQAFLSDLTDLEVDLHSLL